MSKNINDLVQKLANFSPVKSASVSIPEDPAVKGTATDVPADGLITPVGPKGDGEAAKLPEVPTSDPAGEHKVVEGEVASEVPAAKPFAEGGKIANIDSLRQKLANIGCAAPAAAAPAAAPAAPAAVPAVKDPAAEIPKEASEAAPFSYHLVFNAMLKSSSGRASIEDAISEIYGNEKAASLVKQSLAEQEAFEIAYATEQLANLERDKVASVIAEEEARQNAVLNEMLKGASSQEQYDDIRNSFLLLKKAENSIIDNPALHQHFCAGTVLAEKIAAAMQADPAMMEDPGQMPEMAEQGGEPSPEELIAALSELVQSGQITEEQATQIAEQLLGGMEGMGAEGGMGGEGEMPKQASALESSADAHLTKVAAFVEALV